MFSASELVKDIVLKNYKTAEVFEKNNIDFCCHGNIALDEACRQKNVDLSSVMEELKGLHGAGELNTELLPLDQLSAHIITTHHEYIRRMVPQISARLEKVAFKHGPNHRYMIEVKELFEKLSNELLMHLQKEEAILFPIINSQFKAYHTKEYFGIRVGIQNIINVMETEHDSAGEISGRIKELTNDYTVPADGCNTFFVVLNELKEFELDLHKHIFLENSVLFPKALVIETEIKKEMPTK